MSVWGSDGRGQLPTLGVEEEYFLVDAGDGAVREAGSRVLRRARIEVGDLVSGEFSEYQIEGKTPPCSETGELRDHLARVRAAVARAAASEDLRVVASGTPVLGARSPVPLREDPRYAAGVEAYRGLQDGFAFCALQTHVAVPDREAAVLVSNHLRPWLPTLVAIAANSPFRAGRDSGYASWRAVALSRWPIAGPPPFFRDASDYDRLVGRLLDSGAALDEHNLFWDVRPCERLSTVEIRVMDVNAGLEETVAFAVLVRGLVANALERVRRGDPGPTVEEAWLRAAYWRGARDGWPGHGVDLDSGRIVPAADMARRLLARARPALAGREESAWVGTVLERLAREGGGAGRQRSAFARARCLRDVVEDLADHTARVPALSPRTCRAVGDVPHPAGGNVT
ncbi:carboxylate-amine ligase [Embleya scabrispora]|uniref:carboxylate-amine ligase n=1 Tax=Embleya scabrispora TaxID=159449 RepID=UPI001374F701|nr:glutamate--cysteine ligase [Embleya scabrispora]